MAEFEPVEAALDAALREVSADGAPVMLAPVFKTPAEVRSGFSPVISSVCGRDWPSWEPGESALNATHRQTHEIFGTAPGSQISWASEILYFSGQHGAPTIDAIGHIGRNLKLYGGVDAVAATARPDGIGSSSPLRMLALSPRRA